MELKYTKVLLIILLSLVLFNKYSFAEVNSPTIPSFQTYEQNDNKIQVPLLINNNTPENIETSISQVAKEQSIEAKKVEPIITTINDLDAKSFSDKKTFLKESKSEPSLWQGASLVIGFISLIGIIAFLMAKIKRKGLFKNNKNEKEMNIISSLSISPKRQVILLQIRGKEIVIANTETGINFLADVGSYNPQKEEVVEKKPLQISNFIKTLPTAEAVKEKQDLEIDHKVGVNEKKSDILMKALKKMEKNSTPEKANKIEENSQENSDSSNKFPKYFSNIFENEAKKEVKKKEEADSVENVTNLIREKLRSMKPLN